MADALALALFSGNFIFYICTPEKPAGFSGALFHETSRTPKQHLLPLVFRGNIRAAIENRVLCVGLLGENAFGAPRVCVAMKAPVGLLSGERSASADGGALPRQVPQGTTNAK